jgi:succinate dehydrogenase / fumarate reductase membrane anchor subunit
MRASGCKGRGGIGTWLVQRLSGAYIAICSVAALLATAMRPPLDFAEWKRTLTAPHIASMTMLFAIAIAAHAWIGMRDIYMDYVKSALGRACLLAITGLLLLWMVLRLSMALFAAS